MKKKLKPDPGNDDKKNDEISDPIAKLEARRKELADRFEDYKAKSDIVGTGAVLGGVLGGIAVVADIALLGGIGTMLAMGGGAGWLAYRGKTKKAEQALKEIDDRLFHLNELRVMAEMQNPKLKGNLTEEFSPAAKAEIDALRKKLGELEGHMDDLQKPGPKPPFKL